MSDPRRKRSDPAVWHPWRVGELAGEGKAGKLASPATAAEPVGPSLEEELAALREKARREGQQSGLRSGREEGKRLGFEEGHAQGLEAGRQAAAEELQQQIRDALVPLNALAQSMQDALLQMDEDLAQQLVDLALTVGRQMARDSLDAKPAQVLRLVRELLRSEFNLGSKPRLWLHPDDLTLVQEGLGEDLALAGWELHADPGLTRGGCRAEGPCGTVDATWEDRWRAVSRQLRKPRSRRTGKPQETA